MDYYLDGGISEENLTYCWLIGEYNDYFYYIDSSDSGKGYIYGTDLDGRSKPFAQGFLDFLNKLFEVHQERS